MRAIILAGGKGSRLYPYTATLPKSLVPVDDMPILEIVLRQLKYYGYRHVTIAVGHLAGLIKAYFNNGKTLGIKIDYSVEKIPLGTVGPLSLIKDLEKDFLMMNGDLLTSANFASLMKFHRQQRATLTIGAYDQKIQIKSGVLKTSQNLVREYLEKPELPYVISAGIYILSKRVLQYIPKNQPMGLPELFKVLIKAQEKVAAYKIRGAWLDLGNPEDYQRTIDEFKQHRSLYLKGR